MQRDYLSKSEKTGKEPVTKTISVKLDRAETPEIIPGQVLTVDLLIKPADPYKSKIYDFEIFSKPVGQPDETLVIMPGVARIKPLAWFWRMVQIFSIVLIHVLLIVITILITLWLLDVDIWPYIMAMGCNLQHVWGGIC